MAESLVFEVELYCLMKILKRSIFFFCSFATLHVCIVLALKRQFKDLSENSFFPDLHQNCDLTVKFLNDLARVDLTSLGVKKNSIIYEVRFPKYNTYY